MKLVIFILAANTILSNSFAQTKNIALLEKFENSIDRAVKYPSNLAKLCSPTYEFIKISVNEQYKVDKIEISDNADQLLVVEFLSVQNKFNKAILEEYLISNSLRKIDLLIPIIYTFDKYTCQPGSIPIEKCFI